MMPQENLFFCRGRRVEGFSPATHPRTFDFSFAPREHFFFFFYLVLCTSHSEAGMLTVVRRAVPGSTRPRRRAAAAAAGAQQQSSTLHQTSTSGATETSTSSSSLQQQRSFSLWAASGSSASPVPVSRPSPSGSPSQLYPPLPSPRWEVAGQGCGARSSKEARFVANPSSSCSSSSSSTRSIATKAGGAQQEQCRARGAPSAAASGAVQGAEMAVTTVSFPGERRKSYCCVACPTRTYRLVSFSNIRCLLSLRGCDRYAHSLRFSASRSLAFLFCCSPAPAEGGAVVLCCVAWEARVDRMRAAGTPHPLSHRQSLKLKKRSNMFLLYACRALSFSPFTVSPPGNTPTRFCWVQALGYFSKSPAFPLHSILSL